MTNPVSWVGIVPFSLLCRYMPLIASIIFMKVFYYHRTHLDLGLQKRMRSLNTAEPQFADKNRTHKSSSLPSPARMAAISPYTHFVVHDVLRKILSYHFCKVTKQK